MVTGKSVRKWILGLSCTVAPLMGCANSPMPSGGMFSWFRGAPLTEREKLRREQIQATDRLKDPANLHVKYAQWRENLGDLTDARKSYQFALKENPKSLEAKLGLARLDQLGGRTAEAEEGFQNALKSRPGDPQAQNALGQFYASQKQWNKALPLLEEAADAAPTELTYRHHLAVALAQSGDIQGAFHQFKQVSGEAEAHYNIGYLLVEKGHKDMARQRFQQALAMNPQLTQAQMMLDEIDGKTKEPQVAEAPSPPVALPRNPIQQTAAQALPLRPNVSLPSPTGMPTSPSGATTSPSSPVAWRAPAAPMRQTTAAAPVQAAPVKTSQPAPVAPPAPPTWRKHQEVKEAPQESQTYLPPRQAKPQPAMDTPPTKPVTTPPITPAQREQWENQLRAAANQ